MMIELAIAYWAFLNTACCLGGIFGWLELRQRPERGAVYLGRILCAEGLRAGVTIFGLERFRLAVETVPFYIGASAVVLTLLCGAIWGWLLFNRGIINGHGYWDLFLSFVRWKKKPDKP